MGQAAPTAPPSMKWGGKFFFRDAKKNFPPHFHSRRAQDGGRRIPFDQLPFRGSPISALSQATKAWASGRVAERGA